MCFTGSVLCVGVSTDDVVWRAPPLFAVTDHVTLCGSVLSAGPVSVIFDVCVASPCEITSPFYCSVRTRTRTRVEKN